MGNKRCINEFRRKITNLKRFDELGVDVIEAGFPIASPGDYEAVTEISKTLKKSIPAGLARATKKDIDACHEALRHAKILEYIRLFLQARYIWNTNWIKLLKVLVQLKKAFTYARKFTDDVEWSCEDGTRTNMIHVKQLSLLINVAKTINIPDTVGYTVPSEFKKLLKHY